MSSFMYQPLQPRDANPGVVASAAPSVSAAQHSNAPHYNPVEGAQRMQMSMPMAMPMQMPMQMQQQQQQQHHPQQQQQQQMQPYMMQPMMMPPHMMPMQTQQMPMQTSPFPYPLYSMQVTPNGQYPQGTMFYAMPQSTYGQQPMALAKPADLDPSSQPAGWPSFVAMQTVQPHGAAERSQDQQPLVLRSDSGRWDEPGVEQVFPPSSRVINKRKRILWVILVVLALSAAALSLVTVVSPADVFTCSPFAGYYRSYSQMRVDFGYFKYCATGIVQDFNYHRTACLSYADHIQYGTPYPEISLDIQPFTKVSQAFIVFGVITGAILLVGIGVSPKVSNARRLHIILAMVCVLTLTSQVISLSLFITKASRSYNLSNCSPKLLYGGALQIVATVCQFVIFIFLVLLAANRISFKGMFKKNEGEEGDGN